jgi:Domain of unknown function (DUF929)
MTGNSPIESQLLALRRAEVPVTAEEILATVHRPAESPVPRGFRQRNRVGKLGLRERQAHLTLPRVIGWASLVLVVAIGSITVSALDVGRSHEGGGSRPPLPAQTTSPVMRLVASVPESVYEKVGFPTEITNIPSPPYTRQLPLASGGKPQLLYIWATYCPFCAAENWALAMALSKFGTFKGVGTTFSSPTDFAPDTATLDFYRSTYSSPYLDFSSYDLSTDQQVSTGCNVNGYACLQTNYSSYDFHLFQTLGAGSMPFLDFGNKLFQDGAGFEDEPLALSGLAPVQVAEQLSNPQGPIAKAEVGEANYFVAAICKMTGDMPVSACSASTNAAQKQ